MVSFLLDDLRLHEEDIENCLLSAKSFEAVKTYLGLTGHRLTPDPMRFTDPDPLGAKCVPVACNQDSEERESG